MGSQQPLMTHLEFWGPRPATFTVVFTPELSVVLVGIHIC